MKLLAFLLHIEKNMARFNIAKLITSLLLTLGLGTLSSIFTASEITTWYAALIKPSFNPPNFLFAPVWIILYTLMAISFYLIWDNEPSPKRDKALRLFITQMVFNILWSFIFFKLHEIFIALLDIVLMWLFIVFTMVSFYKINPKASLLLVPYIIWVSYATLLNFAIWNLNR